jgi:hypothetical protein
MCAARTHRAMFYIMWLLKPERTGFSISNDNGEDHLQMITELQAGKVSISNRHEEITSSKNVPLIDRRGLLESGSISNSYSLINLN